MLGRSCARCSRPLRGRFQMDRLVLFNQKFSPAGARATSYTSPGAALPRAVFRVLQAEGYLPHRTRRHGSRGPTGWRGRELRRGIEDGIGG